MHGLGAGNEGVKGGIALESLLSLQAQGHGGCVSNATACGQGPGREP